MGADDVMLKNYIETVVAAHEQFPSAQIIQPGVEVIDEHNQPGMGLVDRMKRVYAPRVQGRRLLSGEPLAITLMRGNWLYFPSICWKSDSLVATNFREGLNVVQDLALALDLIKAGGSLVVDSTVCFQYRRHRESDSSWRALEGTRFIEEREFFTGMADEFDAIGWRRAACNASLAAPVLAPHPSRRCCPEPGVQTAPCYPATCGNTALARPGNRRMNDCQPSARHLGVISPLYNEWKR